MLGERSDHLGEADGDRRAQTERDDAKRELFAWMDETFEPLTDDESAEADRAIEARTIRVRASTVRRSVPGR